MARWGLIFLVALLVVKQAAAARVLPAGDNAAGLTDQKNFVTGGGVGSYAGVGDAGIPFGGVFGGVGSGGGLGGTNGFSGVGGIIGTGPNGNPVTAGGVFPGGGVGGLGGLGGGVGGGVGGGAGTGLPHP